MDRIRAAQTARIEYEKLVSAERVKLAARKPAPPATNAHILPGGQVYVHREKLEKLTGPHFVASVHRKHVGLYTGEKTGPRSFNIAQTRPASDNFLINHTILHTEIIHPSDPRSKLFDEAKRKELQGLLERGAFRIALREDVCLDPNIVPSCYVLSIKRATDDKPTGLKARFVIGWHKDRSKSTIVHDTRTA